MIAFPILLHYEYSPFGETVVASGAMKDDFAFRFSTKYFCDEFGMGDWGRRWYSPSMARFTNKDPIGEKGGLNLYVFVENSSQDYVDLHGYSKWGQKAADAIRWVVGNWPKLPPLVGDMINPTSTSGSRFYYNCKLTSFEFFRLRISSCELECHYSCTVTGTEVGQPYEDSVTYPPVNESRTADWEDGCEDGYTYILEA